MAARIAQAPQGRRGSRTAGPEEIVHEAILDYLRRVLPSGAARNIHHARNEGASVSERVRSARLGTKAGWPDLEWFGRRNDGSPYSAMIEVKAARKGPDDEQRACHDGLADAGVLVGVARSIDDARGLLKAWDLPTREAKPITEARAA